MTKICQIQWLGQVEYETALNLQKELCARRAANQIPDTLLLLEHPHTFTVGLDGHREHLLIDQAEMARLNIAFHRVDRGGSVIYHGPGQLVCYPILNLREHGFEYHRYIKLLESVIIHALASLKVRAFREQGQSGVWVFSSQPSFNTHSEGPQPESGAAQIAAVGIKLNQNNITSHGFSINVNPDLNYFKWIVPSGVQGCQVTSLRQVLGRPIEIGLVLEPVIQSFCEIFEMERAAPFRVVREAAKERAALVL